MNILIDYDFYNAVKDVNQGFTISKIVRNNKEPWVRYYLPILTLCELAFYKDHFLKGMSIGVLIEFLLSVELNIGMYFFKGDWYKERADERLKKLVSMLNRINVNTSYDLLKESYCYHKIYNLHINNKLPQVFESKFIIVPSYNYNGDVVDTSILQEHVVGSHEYVLSVNSTERVLKLAYSKI